MLKALMMHAICAKLVLLNLEAMFGYLEQFQILIFHINALYVALNQVKLILVSFNKRA